LSDPAGLEAVDAPAGFGYAAEGATISVVFALSFFVRPEGRFFAPTCRGGVTPRADAVKTDRRSLCAPSSALARPRLDGGEHGVKLRRVGAVAIGVSCAV
jgi:hypothetical protein